MEYQLKNQYICLTVSDVGAEIQSIVKDGTEYLWNGDEKYWPERAPVLFPYVGRFTNGKYLLNGKEYEMDIHGFARKYPYNLIEKTDQILVMQLEDNEETYKMYPYHFHLFVEYKLNKKMIEITYKVLNLSDDTMYFGIGGHPGFMLPFDEGIDFSDYYLEFRGRSFPTQIGITEAGFQSGMDMSFPLINDKYLKMSHDLFNEDSIVLKNMADEVILKSDKGQRMVKVSYSGFPYLGLWHTPKTKAPYLCIEPWTSLPSRQDVIEELAFKYDLIRLREGKEYKNTWSIIIE